MSLLAVTSGSNGSTGSSVVAPEGVDFDGVSDYLSRSTDLVGNVDSKTFTFSCWVYRYNTVRLFEFRQTGAIIGYVELNQYDSSVQDGTVFISFRNSAGVEILAVTSSIRVPNLTTASILVSVDLANTANRRMVINDLVDASPTWTIYTNDVINFTCDAFSVGAGTLGASKIKGRLSHLYLDYTYRDLSIEANRRLFITAEGKPTPTATLKALNPILYLPMKDASTAHINEGTGGNFVQNGTLDTASRGANQDNCKASYFDGTADYLSRTSLTGAVDGRQFTFSCNVAAGSTTGITPLHIYNGSTKCTIRISEADSNGKCAIAIYLKTISNSFIATFESAYIYPINYTLNIVVSIDTLSQLKKSIYVNGKQVTSAWSTYNINTIFPIASSSFYIAYLSSANKGSIGELYFDTKYIDLATNNPFWDADTNRPKPVRQVIRETGITPLIAMPLDASNAGKNYGTGGDFTANSAPYVGARGASEFWARSAKFVASTSAKLNRFTSIPAFNTASLVICHKVDSTASDSGFGLQMLNAGSTAGRFYVKTTVSDIQINSNGVTLGFNRSLPINTWEVLFISFDKITLANNKLIINGVSSSLINYEFLNSVQYSSDEVRIGQTASYMVGESAMYYFTTNYIDFSQETNRLKFVDGLGMPLDLGKQIEKGIIPTPLIYLPFSDSSNLGLNLGTGGNFTVNGAVTAGADVLG